MEHWTTLPAPRTLDAYSSPAWKQLINDQIAAGEVKLQLDLLHTHLVDDTGLGVLIGSLHKLRKHNGRLRLRLSSTLRTIFQATRLDRLGFEFEDDDPTAPVPVAPYPPAPGRQNEKSPEP